MTSNPHLTPREREKIFAMVDCPTCSAVAAPGAACVTPGGKRQTYIHSARVAEYTRIMTTPQPAPPENEADLPEPEPAEESEIGALLSQVAGLRLDVQRVTAGAYQALQQNGDRRAVTLGLRMIYNMMTPDDFCEWIADVFLAHSVPVMRATLRGTIRASADLMLAERATHNYEAPRY